MENNLFDNIKNSDEVYYENKLRPLTIDEYIGQKSVKENVKVFVKAALMRNEAMDHVLLSGPPGLGKTTLSLIISRMMNAELKATSGPAIERPIDLLILLKSLKKGDILFIDEIHRLRREVEEILYPVMEDYCFDRVINKGSIKTAKIKIPHFTLIGATTRSGFISSPLRARFGININLNFYGTDEINEIILRSSGILNIKIDQKASMQIAKSSRGTPRIANRLVRRVRDFAQVKNEEEITYKTAVDSMAKLGIDPEGLDEMDRRILLFIIDKYKGGPVGIETISAAMNEESDNIEEVHEPFLIQSGFLNKTPRGRCATTKAYEHFNKLSLFS